jgi:hypothetical protein
MNENLIDFCINRAVVQEKYSKRVRPPRAFYPDNIIRPYNLEEAKVTIILKVINCIH